MKHVIKRPVITEKSLELASRGWFTFGVDIKSTKGEIASEIASMFRVHVREVRTVVMKGKTRRVGKKRTPRVQENWKKAMVHLNEGETIDLFEVTQEGQSK